MVVGGGGPFLNSSTCEVPVISINVFPILCKTESINSIKTDRKNMKSIQEPYITIDHIQWIEQVD